MKNKQLTNDLIWLGTLDPDLRVFDIIMYTEHGTTYNAYLLKGSEKNALIETTKPKCWDDYITSIKKYVAVEEIDYIVLNHTEPDHSGCVVNLIELNPGITIVGTGGAIGFLKEIVNQDFNSMIVKEGDTLSLGNKTLSFMPLPNLHWPDTMFTYVPEDALLFTCDSFGAHYSHEGVLRSTVSNEKDYKETLKYYFDNIIGPYKHPFMVNALKRIEGLPIKMICVGHGPVLDSHVEETIAQYKRWCQVPEKSAEHLVVMPYVSAYGYTKFLAEEIGKGVQASGNVEVLLYDMVEEKNTYEVMQKMPIADGILFGTPTIVGEALPPILSLMVPMHAVTYKGKLASAFGSYGWSGEGVPHVIERLHQLKFKVLDGFRIRFKPNENELKDAFDYGYNFGCVLQNIENKRKITDDVKKMKKCVVCGAVFEDGVDICPICGVGSDHFIDVEVAVQDFEKNTKEKFLVLGGGASAYHAAKAIRERNKTAEITMVSNESELPYVRTMLTKSMLAAYSDGQMAIAPADWYEENGIVVLLNTEITAIDVMAKEVVCGNQKLIYDKLIYALGAESLVPPITGIERDHVVEVRKIKDVDKIKSMLDTVEDVVIIGGGVLGLEAAGQMIRAKKKVTVLERMDRLLPKQLDEGASLMLSKALRAKGLHLITGAKISEISKREVLLEDGSSYEAQLVIVSTGIKSNTKIAKEAGIAIDRCVDVDDNMRTSVADVYACGDCASYHGTNFALWEQAVEMGEVAGANAAGEALIYQGAEIPVTFLGLGVALYVLGDIGKEGEENYRTIEMKDEKRLTYEKLFFSNNRLMGVILLGDISKAAVWAEKVKNKATYNDVTGSFDGEILPFTL
ncbi:MAG: FAD-dependent oxidoreductase [Lachnospiraceae bacterium]|nr:FAD-dependent oxidoreductase [Lachnospiraceae bacterium]